MQINGWFKALNSGKYIYGGIHKLYTGGGYVARPRAHFFSLNGVSW